MCYLRTAHLCALKIFKFASKEQSSGLNLKKKIQKNKNKNTSDPDY